MGSQRDPEIFFGLAMKKKGVDSNILWKVHGEGMRVRSGHINDFKLHGVFLKMMLEAQEKYPRMLQVGAQLSRWAQGFSQRIVSTAWVGSILGLVGLAHRLRMR